MGTVRDNHRDVHGPGKQKKQLMSEKNQKMKLTDRLVGSIISKNQNYTRIKHKNVIRVEL